MSEIFYYLLVTISYNHGLHIIVDPYYYNRSLWISRKESKTLKQGLEKFDSSC